MIWKYSLVQVGVEEDGEPDCYVFEVYDWFDKGTYDCRTEEPAVFKTVEELRMAIDDIERDGINEWFYKTEKTIQ